MRAEAALKEADRRKDEFLAMLAHELRNPLAPIATPWRSWTVGSRPTRTLQEPLGVIDRQVRHLRPG